MSDLKALYSEAILDHSRSPRHTAPIDDPTHTHAATNPLCGDRVRLQLRVVDGQLEAISARTRGCALCVAASSMMTEWVVGTPLASLEDLKRRIEQAIDPDGPEIEEPIAALTAIRHAPSRVQCVRLPWDSLSGALE